MATKTKKNLKAFPTYDKKVEMKQSKKILIDQSEYDMNSKYIYSIRDKCKQETLARKELEIENEAINKILKQAMEKLELYDRRTRILSNDTPVNKIDYNNMDLEDEDEVEKLLIKKRESMQQKIETMGVQISNFLMIN